MIALIAILTGLAFLLWPAVASGNFSLHASDLAGNGLAAAYTVAATIGLWALLGTALLLAAGNSLLPSGSGWAAVVLVPLSFAAALAVTNLVSNHAAYKWMALIPALLPPLMIAYLVWAIVPGLRAAIPWKPVTLVTWGFVLVLSLPPWRPLFGRLELRKAERAALEAQWALKQAEFAKLTPASPIRDWMAFLKPGTQFQEDALRAIRGMANKQTAIESMLAHGDATGFAALWQVEVEPTEALCAGARKIIAKMALEFRPSSATARFRDVEVEMQSYEDTLSWLGRQRCAMGPELDALTAALKQYPDAEREGVFVFAAIEEARRGGQR